jgi:hypothetical protein
VGILAYVAVQKGIDLGCSLDMPDMKLAGIVAEVAVVVAVEVGIAEPGFDDSFEAAVVLAVADKVVVVTEEDIVIEEVDLPAFVSTAWESAEDQAAVIEGMPIVAVRIEVDTVGGTSGETTVDCMVELFAAVAGFDMGTTKLGSLASDSRKSMIVEVAALVLVGEAEHTTRLVHC